MPPGIYIHKKNPLFERFIAKVKLSQNCWEWQGCIQGDGYGSIRIDGTTQLAHRVSYRLFIGEIPDSLFVCHRCDNRKCVNPSHFFLGSNDQNIQDKVTKNRQWKPLGELDPKAILTKEDVIKIRSLLKEGIKPLNLAEQFRISRSAIYHIKNGHAWNHLKGESNGGN
jgi:hypothetical protein